MKPLEGVRILEITHVISAPFAGMLLGDMGANIIKVEKTDGEFSRSAGPKTEKGDSLWFPTYNRNKKGITANFRNPRAIELLKELVKEVDVVIENFRPGLLNQLGLGYEDLKKNNPKIIMASVSGYGQTGPYANKAAFDMNIEAMSGIMSLTGEPDGIPMKVGTAITDFVAGYCCVIGILTALMTKEKTGEGQYIDVSMLESSLPLLETALCEYHILKQDPPRVGNRRSNGGPSNVFKSKNGYLYISAINDNLFKRLCKIMEREELLTDPRFESVVDRKKNEVELETIVQEWVGQYTKEEISKLLDDAILPNSFVNKAKDVLEDPQIEERGAITMLDYPGIGEFPLINLPIRFSTLETGIYNRAPMLGEHNEEIYSGLLGYTKEELEKFKQDNVI